MTKLVRFELYRNRKKFTVYSGCILLANLILILLDPDMEKVVISISILTILLPFAYMCMDFTKTLLLDFYKNTKYLYLSVAATKNEILCSRLLITAIFAILYIIILSIFQEAHILRGLTLVASLGFSLTALLTHAVILSIVCKKVMNY